MKISKGVIGAMGLALTLLSFDANAWFFFFLPGSVTSKIGDALTGSEGDSCVAETAKVGDTITSTTGNTAIVKSLSGTSSRCQAPGLPIRALLQFNYSFSSKAGIELPDGFKAKEISATQTFNGLLLSAQDTSKSIGVSVAAQPHKQGGDGGALAKNIATRLLTAVEDGKTSNEEELSIGGIPAYRFRMVGKNKGMFGRSFTYVVTVLVGKDEFVQVNANCLTSDFDKYKDTLDRFAFDVKGLNSESTSPNQSELVKPALIAPTTSQSSAPSAPPVDIQSTQATKQVTEIKSATTSESVIAPSSPTPVQTTPREIAAPVGTASIPQKLRDLDKLFKDGVITKNEFETKKAELLKAL